MYAPAPLSSFLLPGQRVSSADLQQLIHAGRVLEKIKRTGEAKVILCEPSGDSPIIIKLWRSEWTPSSTWLRPYASRFRHNAARLRSLGVSAPQVRGWGRVRGSRIHFVSYDRLAGTPLRNLIPCIDLEAAGAYVAHLHELGIDFRSLHLGNILWDAQAGFSLIDVTDCTFGRRFTLKKRIGRIGYFCWHRKDRSYLQRDDTWIRFVRGYCQASGTDPDAIISKLATTPTYRQLDKPRSEP